MDSISYTLLYITLGVLGYAVIALFSDLAAENGTIAVTLEQGPFATGFDEEAIMKKLSNAISIAESKVDLVAITKGMPPCTLHIATALSKNPQALEPEIALLAEDIGALIPHIGMGNEFLTRNGLILRKTSAFEQLCSIAIYEKGMLDGTYVLAPSCKLMPGANRVLSVKQLIEGIFIGNGSASNLKSTLFCVSALQESFYDDLLLVPHKWNAAFLLMNVDGKGEYAHA